MKSEEKLDQLFATARQHKPETPDAFGFETRLLAALREAREPKTMLGLLAWRLLPAFAAITIAVGIYSDRTTPTTDLTGNFLGETMLADYLGN